MHVDSAVAHELFELYSELHLTCGRAAAALRLSSNWDAPHAEMLQRYRREEARAEALWDRIKQLQSDTGRS